MEPGFGNDVEFWLPPEFLTDEDFLMEKENNVFKGIHSDDAFRFGTDESRYGFGDLGFNSGLASTGHSNVRFSEKEGDDESFLAGLTRQMVQSSLEDDFSGGFSVDHAFPTANNSKVWSASHSPQSTLCTAGIDCVCRLRSKLNCQSRVSSPSTMGWDLYYAAAEKRGRKNINEESYDYKNGRGLLGPPRKPVANKNPNTGHGFYNHQALPYQKLQAIQFQQLKQQQLMKHRQLVQSVQSRARISNYKNGGPMDLSSSAWSNLQRARHQHQQQQQQPRNSSGMRAVFLGDTTGKRGSTGTGVFLPRRINPSSPSTIENRKKPSLSSVLVPARVAQVLNLNVKDSAVQSSFESSAGFNDASWREMQGGMRKEQPMNEPQLPPSWDY